MDWLVLGLGIVLGLIAGAFVWTPLAIRENDKRWGAKMARAERWRSRYEA